LRWVQLTFSGLAAFGGTSLFQLINPPDCTGLTKLLVTCPKVWSWLIATSKPYQIAPSVVRDSIPIRQPTPWSKINSFLTNDLIAARSPALPM
jgi:hypothetical protein